jgi:hypothetical protein
LIGAIVESNSLVNIQPVDQLGHRRIPENRVTDGSGAPTRTRRRNRRISRTLPTR